MRNTKENNTPEEVPSWKDEDRIRYARRYASEWRNYANRVIIPLCEECKLPLTTDKMREYLLNPEQIEADYVAAAHEPGLSAFLARTVEEEATRQFAKISTQYDTARPKDEVTIYVLGARDYLQREDIWDALCLKGRICIIDEKVLEERFTHYLEQSELRFHERQENACNALNQFFNGTVDYMLLQSAFIIRDGKISSNKRFNYKLLK